MRFKTRERALQELVKYVDTNAAYWFKVPDMGLNLAEWMLLVALVNCRYGRQWSSKSSAVRIAYKELKSIANSLNLLTEENINVVRVTSRIDTRLKDLEIIIYDYQKGWIFQIGDSKYPSLNLNRRRT